ncbi:MAG: polysaccharide biosynthesis/export family protein [Verrucomicrobiota bacterium]
MKWTFSVFVFLILVLKGISQDHLDTNAGHLLGSGDKLTYRVEEDGDPAVSITVSDAGELEIPLVGRVRASGKTTQQIVKEIKPLLEQEYYHKATIRLSIDQVNPNGNVVKVYLTGEVRKPGPQEFLLNERMTASRIILKAGGFADFANTRKVKIVRQDASGKTTSFEADLKEVLEGGKVELDPEVKDGDLIIVPQKLVRF